MRVHGSCHCGAIAYEAELDPSKVTICHCTDCHVLSGGAYRVSCPVAAASFRLLRGTPKIYVKTAESGTRRRHSFCPECGAPVASTPDVDPPATYSLRIGALVEKHALPPTRQQWCDSSIAWARSIADVPASARQ